GKHDAQRAAEQGHPAHAQEIAQRELDADREHEKDHADLGEELERVHVGHGRAGGEAPDEEPADDVPEDERLPREPRERPADDGGEDDPRQVIEKAGIGGHRVRRRYHALRWGRSAIRDSTSGGPTPTSSARADAASDRGDLLFWSHQK